MPDEIKRLNIGDSVQIRSKSGVYWAMVVRNQKIVLLLRLKTLLNQHANTVIMEKHGVYYLKKQKRCLILIRSGLYRLMLKVA